MMGHRRSQRAWRLPLLLTLLGSGALLHCVQLDGDSASVVGAGEGRTWGKAERTHAKGADANVALDADGNAVVVWRLRTLNLDDWEIWSKRYTPGDGWETAVRIDVNEAGDAGAPAIAMDPGGHAVVVWDQTDGSRFDLWSNRYTPSNRWDAPQRIETNDAGSTFRAQVAIDPSGNVVAVWQQSNGTRSHIWSNRYTPDGDWGTAQRIDANNNASGAQNPQVAMDATGNAVAVWQQSDGTRDNIWSNRYTPSGGWETAERIEVDNAGEASAPHVSTDPDGNALAVWAQSDGTRHNIWSNRYTPGGRWGNAERIETNDAGDALHPRIAMDASGNGLAVWDQYDGTSYDVWSNRYTPSERWGTAERIETNDTGEALRPHVVVNADGDGVVVWEQYDGTDDSDSIWSNRYTPGVGWGAAQRIDGHTDNVLDPEVAIDPNGNAMAVWNVAIGWSDPRHGVWTNRLE